jgi:hypothetical protein
MAAALWETTRGLLAFLALGLARLSSSAIALKCVDDSDERRSHEAPGSPRLAESRVFNAQHPATTAVSRRA